MENLRRIVVAFLTVVLVLIGTGRATSLASAHELVPVSIDGVVLTICHTATTPTPSTPDSQQHSCCDACVPMTAAVLPPPAELAVPVRVGQLVAHDVAMNWIPALGRLQSPRLAQGPPVA